MLKKRVALMLFLVAVSSLLTLTLTLVEATSTVGTNNTSWAIGFPFQRHNFYTAGRFWIFYGDGTNILTTFILTRTGL